MRARIGRILVLCAFGVAPAQFLSQGASGPAHRGVHAPSWALVSTPEAESERYPVSSDLRQRRDARFAHLATPDRDLSQHAHVASHIYALPKAVSLFPGAESDLVLVGVPQAAHAFLAANRSAVYTELEVGVRRAWTRDGTKGPDRISVLYPGGSMTTRQGVVLKDDVASGTTPLDLGHSYMLFLTWDPVTESYNVLRAWDVSDPTPVALNQDGWPSRLPQAEDVKSLAELEDRALLTGLALPAR